MKWLIASLIAVSLAGPAVAKPGPPKGGPKGWGHHHHWRNWRGGEPSSQCWMWTPYGPEPCPFPE